MTDTTRNETFGYELTDKGRLETFSYVLDDFETYIETYWTKTQSQKWDDVDVLPESFRIEYIEKQFDEDFNAELLERSEAGDDSFYDGDHLNCFTIRNTPENLEALEGETYSHDVDEDDESLIMVQTLTEWSSIYYTREFYSDLIKGDLSCNTGIPIEDFQKENVSVNG